MKLIIFFQLIIFLHDTHGFIIPNDRFKRQAVVGWDNNAEPGYLPDYRGDKYTDPQRIKDTQALNKPFFDSIGGEPTYPGGVPPKNGVNNSTNTYYSNQQNSDSSSLNNNNQQNSNSYTENGNQMSNGNNYNDQNPSYTTSVYPNHVQRDYFVPNTYEISTTGYEVLNNGYIPGTTVTNIPILTNLQTGNGPLWQSANPGFLPDYRGDKYTDPQRILDTQNLNKKFFESIGGEPVYPGGVPPKQNIVTSSTSVYNI
ncbi:Hypothetical protein SRAE_2000214300 [Strongyloides ratti]|uniref:Uncharacterized protein n=1 Tax=Strongyloides ratti TaxID=34506 RepID=A0A090LCF8_STRRB|nr:Hypothetical protein SRAE_2000214300 [Strongyloides ratti]CEF67481.1 Hypothetical protein SRAE_2000214300 [Strongyloides ratti]